MSANLKDFRGKVTAETWCWLEATSRATGQDQAVIVRELLHKHACQFLEAAKVADRLLSAEGISGNEGDRHAR